MRIKSLAARPILDSRAQWTIEATLTLKNGAHAAASVPQGKSTGSHEVCALPADVAVRKINSIVPKLIRADFKSQASLDAFLNKLDGTAEKKRLGGNSMLAISIAFARATAAAKDIPLWKYIRSEYGMPVKKNGVVRPRLFINVINGGLHAGNNLNIQEYLVIPRAHTIRESAAIGTALYRELGATLAREKGRQAANLGDEGGFAPNFKDDAEPLHILKRIAKKLHLEKKVDFGIDAAATDIKKIKEDGLQPLYERLIRDYKLIYLEDPFAEERFDAFADFTARYGNKTWITGDDLTTTNVRRMELAHAKRSVNGIIIKPNQIGTISEALDAVRAARSYGWAVICSHRSGETNDDFIADFAWGVDAEGLKLGAPARGERVAKYNRLLEIEKNEA